MGDLTLSVPSEVFEVRCCCGNLNKSDETSVHLQTNAKLQCNNTVVVWTLPTHLTLRQNGDLWGGVTTSSAFKQRPSAKYGGAFSLQECYCV